MGGTTYASLPTPNGDAYDAVKGALFMYGDESDLKGLQGDVILLTLDYMSLLYCFLY